MPHWTEETFVERADVYMASLEQRTDAADKEATAVLEMVSEHGIDPDAVLDIACGIGRHAVEFADRGCDVRGVDLSEQYIERARELAADRGVADRMQFEVGDMRTLDVGRRFDLVTNLFTSFGYYDDPTNETVATIFRDHVADDGALVMELANREGLIANYSDSAAHRAAGQLQVENREYDPATGRMQTRFTVFETRDDGYDYAGEVTWDTRTYAPVELRRLLERAGFEEVSLYGGFDGAELTHDAPRLVAVAQP